MCRRPWKSKFNFKMNKKYAIIFLGPYPRGNVSTMRIHSYSKALVHAGHNVKVYVVAPTKEAAINPDRRGYFEGVEYEYVTKITWSKNQSLFIKKLFFYVVGLFRTCAKLHAEKADYIISYHDQPVANLWIGFFAKIYKLPFVLDRTEYPTNWNSMNVARRWIVVQSYRMYDGIITITKELVSFYSKLLGKDKVFLLPATIDPQRYDDVTEQFSENYIAIVFGVHNRDCLIDSIKAYIEYRSISNGKDTYSLRLIGDIEKLIEMHPENHEIYSLLAQNKCMSEVTFLGKMRNSEVPEILLNAKCLLTTPRSFISGGFPTKLAEYLLSGKPVVCTKTGEIGDYLVDKESALLARPGDVSEIARKLAFLQENEAIARKIGQKGREIALKYFNAEEYVNDLIKFIGN